LFGDLLVVVIRFRRLRIDDVAWLGGETLVEDRALEGRVDRLWLVVRGLDDSHGDRLPTSVQAPPHKRIHFKRCPARRRCGTVPAAGRDRAEALH
jgi:hypothetical protein